MDTLFQFRTHEPVGECPDHCHPRYRRFFRLAPTDAILNLSPGDSLALILEAVACAIKITDAPASANFVADSDDAAVPVPIRMRPFVDTRQTARTSGDVMPVPTPESRYRDKKAPAYSDP